MARKQINTENLYNLLFIAAQAKVLYKNIIDDLAGKPMTMAYTGYSSCPLVTGQGKCIMAEFDYKLQPMETFPVDQSRELYFMFLLKKHFFPFIYWNLMLKYVSYSLVSSSVLYRLKKKVIFFNYFISF